MCDLLSASKFLRNLCPFLLVILTENSWSTPDNVIGPGEMIVSNLSIDLADSHRDDQKLRRAEQERSLQVCKLKKYSSVLIERTVVREIPFKGRMKRNSSEIPYLVAWSPEQYRFEKARFYYWRPYYRSEVPDRPNFRFLRNHALWDSVQYLCGSLALSATSYFSFMNLPTDWLSLMIPAGPLGIRANPTLYAAGASLYGYYETLQKFRQVRDLHRAIRQVPPPLTENQIENAEGIYAHVVDPRSPFVPHQVFVEVWCDGPMDSE
jgi:hypothetical protein